LCVPEKEDQFRKVEGWVDFADGWEHPRRYGEDVVLELEEIIFGDQESIFDDLAISEVACIELEDEIQHEESMNGQLDVDFRCCELGIREGATEAAVESNQE
jgi:hypothetical protein